MNFFKIIMIMSVAISHLFNVANASGLTVDKMFVIADENKNGIVTLSNISDAPLFINANIDEFYMDDSGKEFIRTRYDGENVENWKISTTVNKLILQAGESRNVGIRSLCYNTACDDSKDLMFFVTFMPSPYRTQSGEAGENVASSMQINYGFSPAYIIPTDKPEINYTVVRDDNDITVENKSNTMLYFSVDDCDKNSDVRTCFSRTIVVSGRTRIIPINARLKGKPLKVNISSHDGSYSRKEILNGQGTIEESL